MTNPCFMPRCGCFRSGSGAPTISGTDNDVWLDIPGRTMYVYTGGKWTPATLAGGASLPIATREGQVVVADAALNWQAGDIDAGRI